MALSPVTSADDVVDLEVRAKDKVNGTIRPAEDTELIALSLPAGAVVSAVVKAKGQGGPEPGVELLDPDRQVIAFGAASGRGAKLAKTTVGASGVYRLRVLGDGLLDGDYLLKPKVKPQRLFEEEAAAALDAAAETVVAFAALAGSTCKLQVISDDGVFVPEFVSLEGPDGSSTALTADSSSETKVKAKNVALGMTGDYQVRFRNAGSAAGTWRCKIVVKAPALERNTIDIRDSALAGEFGGTQAVFGSLIPVDGGLVVPTEGAQNLSATQVEIPTGALPTSEVITINEAENFFVDDETFSAGIAVQMGPEGQQFAEPVQITVPFLAQSFDDPTQEMQIVTVDAEGNLTVVPGPYEVNELDGTVSFFTEHFSSFQSVSKQDRPVKGTFLEIEIAGRLRPGFGGEYLFGFNTVHADFGPRSGNPIVRNFERRSISWQRSTASAGRADTEGNSVSGETNGVVTLANDESLTLTTLRGDREYRRGRSPNVLVATGNEDDQVGLFALFRRTKGRPSRGNLVGRWHTLVYEFGTAEQDDGTVVLRQVGQTLDLLVEPNLTAKATRVKRTTSTCAFPETAWVTKSDKPRIKRGSMSIDGFNVVLDMGLGSAEAIGPVTLVPCLAGDVLVGMAGAGTAPGPLERKAGRLVIVVRGREETAQTDLAGRAIVGDFGLRTLDGSPGTPPPLVEFTSRPLTFVYGDKGMLTSEGSTAELRHDLDGLPTAVVKPFESIENTYALSKSGAYVASGPLTRGALTRRGEVVVLSRFENGRFRVGLALPARASATGER